MNKLISSLISIVLVLIMILSLAGCGGTTSGSSGDISGSGSETSGSDSGNGSSGDSSGSGSSDSEGAAKTEEEILEKMKADTLVYSGKNTDTVGWLYLENTSIDESVVKSSDNDFYLRRNNLKSNDFNGCYFLDFRTITGKRTNLSKNTVIYGHSMDDNPNGARFSQLKKYQSISYCKDHQAIYFTTPEAPDMVWQIFAVFFTDINFDYINPNPNNSDFLKIITTARQRSLFNFDVDVSVSDHILTLSTCTYVNTTNRKNYRYVVMAKLLPANSTLKLADVTTNSLAYKVPKG